MNPDDQETCCGGDSLPPLPQAGRVTGTEVCIAEAFGVRTLHLGTSWVQGSMLLNAPFDIELEYVRRMMGWLLFVEPDSVQQRQALQLGLGAATLTKFCHRRLGMRTTAVEINPQVVAVCRQSFELPDDGDRLQVLLADAGTEIRRPEHQGRFDAVQLDVYDHRVEAPLLDSVAFYADCRELLTPDGCLALNCTGTRHRLDITLARLVQVFGRDAVLVFWPTREGNTVVLARRAPAQPDRATWLARARVIQERWGLSTERWLSVLESVRDTASPTIID